MCADAASPLDRALSRRGRAPAAPLLAGAVATALIALFVAWPVVLVVVRSAAHHAELAGPVWLGVLGRSLAVAAVSATLAVACGSILAYAVTRADVSGKRVVAIACRLPAVLPPFFAALALLLLFGDGGLVAHTLGLRVGISGFAGIVLAQILAFLPDAFLVMVRTLRRTDDALEEAALNLGATEATTARRVTLALARPGLASAALIVFTLSLSDFGNPFLIGGGFGVLATEIYARAAGAHDLGGAAASSLPLLGPCLLAHALNVGWIGAPPRPSRWAIRLGVGRRRSRAARRLFLVAAAVGAGSVLCLYGGIAIGSIVRQGGLGWEISLRHYRGLATAGGAALILDTLALALLASGIGSVFATVVGRLIARGHTLGARLIETCAWLPAALPGTVLGVGYLLAFTGTPVALAGTVWILVASVVFGKLPRAVSSAVERERSLDPSLEEVARSLGAGPVRTLTRVTLPGLVPAGVASFVDFFVDSITTVSALILLVYPGFMPLAVASLEHAQRGDLGIACALGTVVGALALGAGLLRRLALDPASP